MRFISARTKYSTYARTSLLGLALIGLVSCSSGDSTTPVVTSSGSAALQGPIVFVNNTTSKSLTSVALKGDSGNAVLGSIDAAEFENVALGDMQFTEGEWVFVNLAGANKVATIDPLTNAQPVHEVNLAAGTRPVHMYRDPNDGEVVWIMNDGDNAGGTPTPGDDLVNCNNPARVGGPVLGGSVTAVHNSHLGPGGTAPFLLGTTCLLADGHKVAAFSSGVGLPKRVFVSSEDAGEISVIDGDESSLTYRQVIHRIDLCRAAKEGGPCDDESATPSTTAFTPNNSAPHGIRWSKLTKKIYSIQEGYGEIAEIDPVTFSVTPILDLTGLPYTAFGISPDGRFLLLRGQTTAPQATKLGVLDLSVTPAVRTDFTIADLNGTAPGSFKFSPDGNRLYILAANSALATVTKKDKLFAFDSSTLTATPAALTLLREISLVSTGAHSFDVLAQGAGAATFIAVSNSTDNSLSVINATDNLIKQTVQNIGAAGSSLGGVMVYAAGTAAAGNQATSSLTGGSAVGPSVLPERLDDHGMKE
jgi:DNA-binding beta-propeller fold protein YncE